MRSPDFENVMGNKPFRLGVGEFEDPGGEVRDPITGSVHSMLPYSVQRAQELFLDAVAEVTPDVFRSLYEGPGRHLRNRKKLQDSLQRWAERWHLTDHWCLNMAWDCLFPLDGVLCVPPSMGVSIVRIMLTDDFSFSHHNWSPTEQTKTEFERDIRHRFGIALKDYCDKIERKAIADGLHRTSSTVKRDSMQFYWLAGFQVLGWSYNAIGNATGRARGTVQKQIKDLAAFVRLRLRDEQNWNSSQTSETISKILQRVHPRDLVENMSIDPLLQRRPLPISRYSSNRQFRDIR
jgi:hypothetical protein